MDPKSLPIVRLAALGFTLLAKGALGAILYDASLGTLPAAQGWSFAALFGSPSQSVGGGVLNLDTTSDSAIRAGYLRFDQVVDSAAGVRLSFSAQLLTEARVSNDRAGFSVILLDNTNRGIELGFWTSPGPNLGSECAGLHASRGRRRTRLVPQSSTTPWSCKAARTPSVPIGRRF